MELIQCYECFYSIFGKCPVNGSRSNAVCLHIAKAYFDMSRKELEEITEKEYKEALRKAAQTYHARMDYISTLFKNKGEEKQDDEEISIH